jgi:hypothetical protein
MDEKISAEIKKEQAEIEVEKEVIDQINKGEKGKLILAEDIEEGHVSWKAIKLFLKALGGKFPFLFVTVWVASQFLYEWCNTVSVWFLGFWGSQYQGRDPSEVSAAQWVHSFLPFVHAHLICQLSLGVFSDSRYLHCHIYYYRMDIYFWHTESFAYD